MSPGVKRLQQDLKQLQEQPLVGANAAPATDQDILTWFGLVIGSEGSPLSGIPIRFCLEFPNDYPNNPPKAYFESYIAYNNGAVIKDSKGRTELCLNIFGNFNHIHTEWASQSEGWTPSYTVSTILISVQAMMMDGMLCNRIQSVQKMTDSALNFNCDITGHKGSDRSTWFPQIITDPQEAQEISKKFRKPIQTVLDTYYICYSNSQLNGNNSALGYGIHIENTRSGMLSSPCEYLSYEAFAKGNVRRSSTNAPFEHWLPISIKNEDWATGRKIRTGFFIHVDKICEAIGFKGNNGEKVFKICSSLMNGLVVQIMKNGDNPTANDKFINGYFAIYKLLTLVAKEHPVLVHTADRFLQRFKTEPTFGTKKTVPNLGEFLIYLTISSTTDWSDIAQTFLDENDTRNVFWYVKGNYHNAPAHPELYVDKSSTCASLKSRCEKVFRVTQTSRNLILFQVKFANVAKLLHVSGILELDSNYGLAPDSLRVELKKLYGEIVSIRNWDGFYLFLEMPCKSDEVRGKELLQAVVRSGRLGYT